MASAIALRQDAEGKKDFTSNKNKQSNDDVKDDANSGNKDEEVDKTKSVNVTNMGRRHSSKDNDKERKEGKLICILHSSGMKFDLVSFYNPSLNKTWCFQKQTEKQYS